MTTTAGAITLLILLAVVIGVRWFVIPLQEKYTDDARPLGD